MQLYSASASPFVRKCRVCILETGQEGAVEILDAVGTPLDSSNMPTSHNPLGKIPALVRNDGPALYDSRVITRYLNDLAGGTLYPKARLWETLTLEATADGIMEAAVLMIYEGRCRPEELQSNEWVDAQWTKAARALDAIESRWMSHLSGPLDMAQIATGCALEYLDFRHAARDWRAGRPELSAWQAEFARRPSMVATRPVV
ncbi:MAG: glutathione S-transferase family protein [Rhodobacteraceae bacterium]|nr:glutathione S-transferase family protein [Paracoccaceae bacterium]